MDDTLWINLSGLDFAMLMHQKAVVTREAGAARMRDDKITYEALEGLTQLIDFIQAQAVLQISEQHVFGDTDEDLADMATVLLFEQGEN